MDSAPRSPDLRPLQSNVTAGSSRPIRVLVVDDHPLTRTGISAILRQQPDIEIVGEEACAQAALEAVRSRSIDVAVLDLRLGTSRRDGLDLADAIWGVSRDVRVVLYSNYVADQGASLLDGANILGVVLKTDYPGVLVDAVRAAARLIPFISPEVTDRIGGR